MVDWLVNKLDGDRSNFVNHYAAEDPFLFKLTGYLDNVSSARFRRDRLRTDIFAGRFSHPFKAVQFSVHCFVLEFVYLDYCLSGHKPNMFGRSLAQRN